MGKYFVGKKIGMTQIVDEDGKVIPITVVESYEGQLVAKKEKAKDGYESIVIGFEDLNKEKCNKVRAGFFEKLGVGPKKYIKEFRVNDSALAVLDILGADVFGKGEIVNVRGKTIGKGFAGSVKRHHKKRGPMTHGSKSHRIPGSNGAGTDPGNVPKGSRRPGHLGSKFRTIRNLRVVDFDKEKRLVFIEGAVPGKRDNLLEIFN